MNGTNIKSSNIAATWSVTHREALQSLEFVAYMENHPAVKQKAARRIRAAVNYLLEKMSEQ